MHLSVNDDRINGPPDIIDGRILDDLDGPGVGINLNLADVHAVGEVAAGHRLIAVPAAGSRRSSGRSFVSMAAPATSNIRSVGRCPSPRNGRPRTRVGRRDSRRWLGDAGALGDDVVRRVRASRCWRAACPAGMSAAADLHDVGIAGTSRTLSKGTPSHSVTSCAKLVSWPWPCETIPITTSTRPSGLTVISARSRGTPVAVST